MRPDPTPDILPRVMPGIVLVRRDSLPATLIDDAVPMVRKLKTRYAIVALRDEQIFVRGFDHPGEAVLAGLRLCPPPFTYVDFAADEVGNRWARLAMGWDAVEPTEDGE